MQKNPHLLVEGCIIGSIAAGANKGFIFIRGEYELQADILDAAVAEAYEKGYLGDGHPRLRALVRPGRAPRPGRLHLRRGDRPARRARGQARQPAPEAAVPGQPGPLPGSDADQQRRDALQHADHHRARRRVVQAVRRGQLDRHEARVRLRQRAAPGQLRGRARASRCARSSTASPAARPRAASSSASSPAARRRRCCTQEHLDLPFTYEAMAEAGSMLGSGVDHRGRRLAAARAARAAARRVLPARVVRQVRAVPRGHELDREDARADRRGRGHADGPRHPRPGPGQHHRQLPVRARRLDGDAGRVDAQALPRRVRAAHGGGAQAPRPRGARALGAPELAAVPEAGAA